MCSKSPLAPGGDLREGVEMKRHIITGRSNPILGKGIAAALSQAPAEYTVEVFPEGEVYVCIETPLIVDDMISTAGTLVAAIKVVLEKWCATKIFVAATHGLFVNMVRQMVWCESCPPLKIGGPTHKRKN
jgi:phosphoribosylpyrophosphate synthetase